MVCNNKVAIIPARSGSKGLPNKNILTLIDRPLIAYTILAAIESNLFDKVIVSTDSLEYKKISEEYGAEVLLRSPELSSDTATSYMVIADVISRLDKKPDYFMLLQPTSPFRDSKHIKEAASLFENSKNCDYLVSVAESFKSSYLIKEIDKDQTLKNFDLDYSSYRRQKHQEFYPNGAIFVGYTDSYLKQQHFFGPNSKAYFMTKRDSVDIDDETDFLLAITIANKKNTKKNLNLQIVNRIEEKRGEMNKCYPITFMGHSIFDYWDIKKINNKRINNLGIAGINTHEYLDYILKKNYISKLGDDVVLFCGTNDIVIEGWSRENTLDWIEKTADIINKINSKTRIFLLSVPKVRGRMDRDNSLIEDLNVYLQQNLREDIKFIDITTGLTDEFGNLSKEYTTDGLHFTRSAYEKLEIMLSKVL